MQLVDLEGVSPEAWREVVAGERDPFGGGVAETLHWRDKRRNVGLRDDAGRLLAMGGLVLVEVRVGEAEPPLAAVGVGGVIVTRCARGRGIGRELIERLLELAPELGAELAMLFCIPANVALYEKFGFALIEAPVWVRQPSGLIEMPMHAMWKALAGAARWPEGPVELLGEPF